MQGQKWGNYEAEDRKAKKAGSEEAGGKSIKLNLFKQILENAIDVFKQVCYN